MRENAVGLSARHSVGAACVILGCWGALQGCQPPDYADFASSSVAGTAARSSGGGADAGSSFAGSAAGGLAGTAHGGASAGTSGTAASGDTSIGGSMAGTGSAGAPAELCGKTSVCVPSAPTGWLGPTALWEDTPATLSAPPSCPSGYGQPADLHGQLLAASAACSCSCSATGQHCDSASAVSVYGDLGCGTECIAASPLACAPVSGCTGSAGTMRAEIPIPSGGSCAATVTPQAPPMAHWKHDARSCTAAVEGASCAGSDEVCVATPTAPYASQLCVYQIVLDGQPTPTCPAAYPLASDTLYAAFSDNRGCSPCTCAGPVGGTCSGTLTLSGGNDCGSGFQYTLGSGCQSFSLSAPPSHIQGNYALSAGSCAIAQDTHATGSAQASGNARAVCCR